MKLRFWEQEERAFPPMSVSEYIDLTGFSFGGSNYQVVPSTTMAPQKEERVDPSFAGYIRQVYKTNGPIYSCMAVRLRLFSEVRFQWSQMQQGRRGKLFGTQELDSLENPWPATTPDAES